MVRPASFSDDFKTVGERPAGSLAATHSRGSRTWSSSWLESTGVQFMDLYGSPYPTTPNLSAEAGNSLVFGNVYSNACYTVHALMPLILSQYPGTGFETYATSYPHLAGTSAAQVLHDRGYRTAFMTGALLDYKDARAFSTTVDSMLFMDSRISRRWASARAFHPGQWTIRRCLIISSNGYRRTPPSRSLSTAWTQQTHHPYTLPAYQRRREFVADQSTEAAKLLNLYLNDLHGADEQLGRLFAFLRQNQLDGNTLVVITGDHGEGFGFPHHWMFSRHVTL